MALQFKRHRLVARRPPAGDRRKILQKREPVGERDVFAEDDEIALVIEGLPPFTIRTDEKGGIVIIRGGGPDSLELPSGRQADSDMHPAARHESRESLQSSAV